MNKVLILGINGFTGKHFQDYIAKNRLEERYFFVGADREIERKINIDYRKIDLLDWQNLQELVIDVAPDYIMNFVGIFRANEFSTILGTNAELSRRLLDIVVNEGLSIRKLLFIGSAAEYGMNSNLPLIEDADLSPVNFYGLSKVIQTHYVRYYYRKFNTNVNIARTFNIIGKCMLPMLSIPSFLKQVREVDDGGVIYVGNLNTKRDFLDVSDIVDAYWKILFEGHPGEIYNVCRGRSYLMKDILDYMIEKSGKIIDVTVKDEYVKIDDISDIYGDNSKLVNDTGWNCRIGVYEAVDKILMYGG
jgi:GDP-4-dehydro-6-deoxy-D-mannose reductase